MKPTTIGKEQRINNDHKHQQIPGTRCVSHTKTKHYAAAKPSSGFRLEGFRFKSAALCCTPEEAGLAELLWRRWASTQTQETNTNTTEQGTHWQKQQRYGQGRNTWPPTVQCVLYGQKKEKDFITRLVKASCGRTDGTMSPVTPVERQPLCLAPKI